MIHFILAAQGATQMTIAMEFHDTYLRQLHCDTHGAGYAILRAVIYRSEGEVFKDAQESGYQELRLAFTGMRIEGEIPDLEFDPYASDGELWIDGKNSNGMAYLPLDQTGQICLELRINPLFETLKIHATYVRSTLQGPFDSHRTWDAGGPVS